MSKIQTVAGTWDETCTYESDLAANSLKEPVYRTIMEFAEPRMLSTLIISGAKSPWDLQSGRTDVVKTKIGSIPKDKLIGDSAMRYRVMGRIQKEVIINGLVSASTTTGDFSLSVQDAYLYPGMNVTFWYPGLQARVQSAASGTPGNYVYQFRTVNNQPFVYNTHVAPQPGTKTLFGQYTSYGEKSLRGYDRSHYPDEFINHLTTQRKGVAISGDALNQVLKVTFNGATGWYYEKLRQAKIRFMLEDEYQKWFGQSTMKDAAGNLLNVSTLFDDTGNPITAGDGVWEQLKGGNEAYSSGINGKITIEDLADMMSVLEKNSDSIYGKTWHVITGTEGYGEAQDLLRDYWVDSLGGHLTKEMSGEPSAAGYDISVGGNFDNFSYRGNKLIFCKHPMWSDEKRFNNYRAVDGTLIQGGTLLFLDSGTGVGGSNLEILTKGAYGSNRSMVMAEFNGMTGDGNKPVSPIDAKNYELLKQDGIFIYNTTSCGILHRSLS